MPPVVAAAGIAAGASLIGGAMQGKAAKGAAKTQADMARLALEEQKRIYDIESKKDEERYRTERGDLEYDRSKTLADEQRVRASRSGAFGGFGSDLAQFSKGYAPAYGMSADATQGVMDARNAGVSVGGGGFVPPSMGDPGMGPKGLGPSDPSLPLSMPKVGGQSASFGSTVWLQAPTGETAEVPISDAAQITKMLQAGAQLIPAPTGGQ